MILKLRTSPERLGLDFLLDPTQRVNRIQNGLNGAQDTPQFHHVPMKHDWTGVSNERALHSRSTSWGSQGRPVQPQQEQQYQGQHQHALSAAHTPESAHSPGYSPAMSSTREHVHPRSDPSLVDCSTPIKNCAPTCPLDSLLLDFLSERRQRAADGLPAQDVVGPRYPSVSSLLNPANSVYSHPLSKVFTDILATFPDISTLPERVAVLYIMFLVMRWQIAPTQENYDRLPEWMAPRSSQLSISHAAWLDHIPFPKMRDRLVRDHNPLLYPFDNFFIPFTTTLTLSWPYEETDTLLQNPDSDELMINPVFERHLRNLDNWKLGDAFAKAFPTLVGTFNLDSQSSARPSSAGSRLVAPEWGHEERKGDLLFVLFFFLLYLLISKKGGGIHGFSQGRSTSRPDIFVRLIVRLAAGPNIIVELFGVWQCKLAFYPYGKTDSHLLHGCALILRQQVFSISHRLPLRSPFASTLTVYLYSHRLPLLSSSTPTLIVYLYSHRLPLLSSSTSTLIVYLYSHRLPLRSPFTSWIKEKGGVHTLTKVICQDIKWETKGRPRSTLIHSIHRHMKGPLTHLFLPPVLLLYLLTSLSKALDLSAYVPDTPEAQIRLPPNGPNNQSLLLDEMSRGNAADPEDEDETTDVGDGDDVTNDADNKDAEFFDVEELVAKMTSIDLDDSQAIASSIADAMSDDEKQGLMLTKEDEDGMTAKLPSNEEAVTKMEDTPALLEAVCLFRERLRIVIDRLVQFFLCIGRRDNCPRLMRGWFLFGVANAEKESRDRLVRILTHESVISLPNQYIFGLDEWTPDMFDIMQHIDLKKIGQSDNPQHFVTAYAGVAHCSVEDHVLYCGSATSLAADKPLMGEEQRMVEHRKMLAGGLGEVLARREAGTGWCLYIHEMMGTGWRRFILRPHIPVPGAVRRAPRPEGGSNGSLRGELFDDPAIQPTVSRQIVDGLRPKEFPAPCWGGANLVLPMLQNPAAIWKLLGEHVHPVKQTRELMDTLQRHFEDGRKPWLSRDTCREILVSHNQSVGSNSNRALRAYYSLILNENGLEYQNLHQLYLRRLSILWVAIIREVEDSGPVKLSTHSQRYCFSATNLDWHRVSARAQGIAPDDLRANYSAKGCESLYKDSHSVYFNQQVLNKCNWDELSGKTLEIAAVPSYIHPANKARLSGGLPEAFSSFRPGERYPRVLRARIWHVCRHFLYEYMREKQYLIGPEKGIITLHPKAPLALTFLHERIIGQLKNDTDLCDLIKVESGAWEDESFKAYLATELHDGRTELRVGISRRTADKWRELELLDEDWVVPPSTHNEMPQQDIEPTKEDMPASLATGSLAPRHIENFKLLMACHVNAVSIPSDAEGEESTSDSHNSDDSDGDDADSDDADSDGDDNHPDFELRGVDGKSTRGKLFTILSRDGTASLALGNAGPANPTRGKRLASTKKPWTKGGCPYCGLKLPPGKRPGSTTHMRADHERKCIGRCYRCIEKKLICVSQPKNAPCGECSRAGVECKRPPMKDRDLHEKGECSKCHRRFRRVKKHEANCPGKCKNCRETTNTICKGGGLDRGLGGGERCNNCKKKGLTCGDFSHPVAKKECDDCGNLVSKPVMWEHKRKCQKRCSHCASKGTACTRADLKSTEPCKQCVEDRTEESCDAGWVPKPTES
ncbi:hypothetical protein NM208_g8810 [Fusarium decemcellulare]|uniref:Uncharacterized protein n=1 Tax=Fusarium decemcellulare TaxID=57161 RepID=A0ACC1S3W5_9HYPO|nr:hypothetical protein NM208_g8810 [Fusarium decemcellulare]